ncbi:TraX family protein [Kluyvera sichuanensis]
MFSLSNIPSRTVRLSLIELSPRALDTIKLCAFLAMLLDHFNTLFLTPARPEIYAIGRMAFPLFCLVWAINVLRKPEKLQQNANKLWIWAAITQPIFYLAFHKHDPWYALNILFVFATATQLLAWVVQYGKKGGLYGTILFLAIFPLLIPASYGLQGLVLALALAVWLSPGLSRLSIIPEIIILIALLSLNGIIHIVAQPANTLLFAILPTLFLPLATISFAQNLTRENDSRFMPRHFFYLSYAGHLLCYAAVLAVI